MRKTSVYIFLSAICLTAGIYMFGETNHNVIRESLFEDESEEDAMEEIAGALEFDFLKKRDPVTGQIPYGNLMQAYRSLKARGFYNAGENRADTYGWEHVNDFFPSLAVTKMCYDPNNTSVFYFCTGEGWFNADAVKGAGVFKSSDGGETWVQLEATNNATYAYCQDIAVHPLTSDLYVATKSGMFRSQDGGTTFKKVLGAGAGSVRNTICDIEITSDGGVFAGIGIFETDGIYYSSNGDSATYTKQINGFPTSGIYNIELATAPSNPDVCYAIPCTTTYKIKGVYKTTDRGLSWDTVSLPGNNYDLAAKQAWYDLSLAVDPEDENIVAAGGLNVFRTQDGGLSWQQITSGRLDSMLVRYMHVDQHDIVFQNSDTVYFLNDGGIYKCDNFSAAHPAIYDANFNYNVTQYYAISAHPGAGDPRIIGGTQDNGTTMLLNNGISDMKFVSGADGAYCAFNYEDGDKFYTTTQFRKIFRFNNGGFEIPDTITNSQVLESHLLFINPLEISPYDPDVLFQASSIGLWRLNNASVADSTQWVKACSSTGSITTIAGSIEPQDIIFFGKSSANGEIYMVQNATTSDGSLFPVGLDPLDELPDATVFGSYYCSSISADRADANHILLSYANYGVNSIWESSNALSAAPEWHSVEGDLPDVPVNNVLIHPFNSNVAYAATEIGVFYTDMLNGALTEWKPCNSFPVVRTDMLKFRPSDNTIIAGTHGRGIWQAVVDETGLSNDIAWLERGPTNVGGRTRTLMVDPNEPSGKKVWTGSVSGGLWKTTDIDIVSIPESSEQKTEFTIFPNPAHDIVNIKIENVTPGNYIVQIYDIHGNIISTKNKNASNFSLDVSSYIRGIYFIALIKGNTKTVRKIVVQ